MKNQSSKKWIQQTALVSLILLITLAHYLTPVSKPALHEFFRRLYYLPLIIAAFQFGRRGGLIASISISLLYLPHVVFQWSGPVLANLVRFDEIIMYLIIGNTAGFLAERIRREKENYRSAAEKLDKAYQQLREKTEQMSELEHQLRSADRLAVLGELTASLAHEVRNPLGSIKGAADILKKKCLADQTCREFCDVLSIEVNRLNGVVENYLNVARQVPVPEPVTDIIPVIESVLQLNGPQLRKKQIGIDRLWDPGACLVRINEVEARQVFLNLMLNALAALEAGGQIRIQIERQKYRTNILFSDNGPGIPSDQIDHIFDLFFTTRKEGTGLGLAIVRRIVESYKGRITVKSKIGEGTTFTLSLQNAGGAKS